MRLKKWVFYMAEEMEENYKIIELTTKRHYYEKTEPFLTIQEAAYDIMPKL
jgi:hypothetical protein